MVLVLIHTSPSHSYIIVGWKTMDCKRKCILGYWLHMYMSVCHWICKSIQRKVSCFSHCRYFGFIPIHTCKNILHSVTHPRLKRISFLLPSSIVKEKNLNRWICCAYIHFSILSINVSRAYSRDLFAWVNCISTNLTSKQQLWRLYYVPSFCFYSYCCFWWSSVVDFACMSKQ